MGLWLAVFLLTTAAGVRGDDRPPEPRRDDFPRDFVFGSGTSAYQVEGAASEDGRTPSVWDIFAHKGTSNGDVAADGYHKYKGDVKLMAEVGLEGYRFSISWSRLMIPNGRGDVNPKGLDYYNNLIDELINHGPATRFGKHKHLRIAFRAQNRDFFTGWFMQPLVTGDYPETMKKFVSHKILKFSKNQSRELIGAFDFIGLNYYNICAVKDNTSNIPQDKRDFLSDISADISGIHQDKSDTKISMSYGLQGVLEYIKQNYGNPPIYIQENGYVLPHNNKLDDTPRVRHLHAHVGSLLSAIRNGSNTLGYFTWSFLDEFELLHGYQSSYGMVYVDFDDEELKRYPKLSAHWYSNFLKRKECY